MKNVFYSISITIYIIALYIIFNYIFLSIYKIINFGINNGMISSLIFYLILIGIGFVMMRYADRITKKLLGIHMSMLNRYDVAEISLIIFTIFQFLLIVSQCTSYIAYEYDLDNHLKVDEILIFLKIISLIFIFFIRKKIVQKLM